MATSGGKIGSSGAYAASTALASAALFGAATPVSKALLGNLSAFQLAGLLYLGAAVGMIFVTIRNKDWSPPWRMTRRNQRLMLGAVISGGTLGPVLLLFGLKLASSASVNNKQPRTLL